MQPSLREAIFAAFHARPRGMFVAPNWVGLAAFGLLGLLNPGFWLVGAGLEVAYLLSLAQHPRFRRHVAASKAAAASGDERARLEQLREDLDEADRVRFDALWRRCEELQGGDIEDTPGAEEKDEGVAWLLWLHLRLLTMRRSLIALIEDAETSGESEEVLAGRLDEVQARLQDESDESLRRSLTTQAELLARRVANHREAGRKVEYLESELLRVEHQVELLREEAVLADSHEPLGRRLDRVARNLDETRQWVRAQSRALDELDDGSDRLPARRRAGARERAGGT